MSRTARRFVPGVIAALTALSPALCTSARAEESNRNEVRANLERDGWRVIWGKNFTEADWARGTKAIAESIASDNPGPFLEWFGSVLDENFSKIERNLQNVTRQDLERWIVQSLRQKQVIRYGGLRIQAGFATYNRWQRVVYDEPRTRQKKVSLGIGWTYVPEAYTERVEKRVPLPNWNQFYIRYQLVEAGGSGASTSDRPHLGGSPTRRIDYTIWNDSGRTVTFRLPSGQQYSLRNGERGNYHNTGDPESFRILVLNTGHEYRLTAGHHKFWWMRNENRFGLDLNYDRN